MSLLKTRPNDYDREMFEEVLLSINGTDLNKLELFYSTINNQDAYLNFKSLKKIKSLSLDKFDYKKFLNRPLEIAEIYLDDINLQFFAKLLPKLNTSLTSSKVYVVWCLKNDYLVPYKFFYERVELGMEY